MKPVFEAAIREPKRLVYAEGEALRVLRAVQVVVDDGMAKPILIGRLHKRAQRTLRRSQSYGQFRVDFRRLRLRFGVLFRTRLAQVQLGQSSARVERRTEKQRQQRQQCEPERAGHRSILHEENPIHVGEKFGKSRPIWKERIARR